MAFLIPFFIIVLPGLAYWVVESFSRGNGILFAIIFFILGIVGSFIWIIRADGGTTRNRQKLTFKEFLNDIKMPFGILFLIIGLPSLAYEVVESFSRGNGILFAIIFFILGMIGSFVWIARADRGTNYGSGYSGSDSDSGFFSFMSFGDSGDSSSSWGGDCGGGDSGGSCD